jgi:hypothetical protein
MPRGNPRIPELVERGSVVVVRKIDQHL